MDEGTSEYQRLEAGDDQPAPYRGRPPPRTSYQARTSVSTSAQRKERGLLDRIVNESDTEWEDDIVTTTTSTSKKGDKPKSSESKDATDSRPQSESKPDRSVSEESGMSDGEKQRRSEQLSQNRLVAKTLRRKYRRIGLAFLYVAVCSFLSLLDSCHFFLFFKFPDRHFPGHCLSSPLLCYLTFYPSSPLYSPFSLSGLHISVFYSLCLPPWYSLSHG